VQRLSKVSMSRRLRRMLAVGGVGGAGVAAAYSSALPGGLQEAMHNAAGSAGFAVAPPGYTGMRSFDGENRRAIIETVNANPERWLDTPAKRRRWEQSGNAGPVTAARARAQQLQSVPSWFL
jgi:hypothetical protein